MSDITNRGCRLIWERLLHVGCDANWISAHRPSPISSFLHNLVSDDPFIVLQPRGAPYPIVGGGAAENQG